MLVMITAFTMSVLPAHAQIQIPQDVESSANITIDEGKELKEQNEAFLDKGIDNQEVELSQPENQNITIDYLAPLGGEMLLLSCLGGAYLIGRRKKEKK